MRASSVSIPNGIQRQQVGSYLTQAADLLSLPGVQALVLSSFTLSGFGRLWREDGGYVCEWADPWKFVERLTGRDPVTLLKAVFERIVFTVIEAETNTALDTWLIAATLWGAKYST